MKRIPSLLALLLVTALACKTSSVTETFTPSGGFLYQETFSNSNSGWGEKALEAGAAGYTDGAYRIVVNLPDSHLWSRPGLSFGNLRVEVAVFPAAGPPDSRMGLICRLVDDHNFYFFAISADGFYGIGKMKEGRVSILTGDGAMLPSETIHVGSVPNQARGDCVGSTLTLYVNNQKVDSVEDGDFAAGDVGIFAGTFAQPGADVYFDNFFVLKP